MSEKEHMRKKKKSYFIETRYFTFIILINFATSCKICLSLNVADLLERKFACQDDITFHLVYMHSCFFRKLQFYFLFICQGH